MAKPAPLTEEERAQKRAADREYVQQAVEALRTSDGWRRWLATRAVFHRYSLTNQLLIAMQRPTAVRVAGFRKWLQLGYCVRKGEKAIRIWAPCPPSAKKIQAWKDAGAKPDERPRTFFKLTSVFADDQVQELPPPAVPQPISCPIRQLEGDDLAECLPALARARQRDRLVDQLRADRRRRVGLLRAGDQADRDRLQHGDQPAGVGRLSRARARARPRRSPGGRSGARLRQRGARRRERRVHRRPLARDRRRRRLDPVPRRMG